MKVMIAVVVGLAGVALSVAFLTIGGIVQAINGATAHPVDAVGIAVGVVRFFLTGLGIWVSVGLGGLIALKN